MDTAYFAGIGLIDLEKFEARHADLDLISWCASGLPRFYAQQDRVVSVAEHQMDVRREALRLYDESEENARSHVRIRGYINDVALLHDSEEAYTGDMMAPMKRHPEMAWFRELGDRIRLRIFEKYLPAFSAEDDTVKELVWSYVKKADIMLLGSESEDRLHADVSLWNLRFPRSSYQYDPRERARFEILNAYHGACRDAGLFYTGKCFEARDPSHAIQSTFLHTYRSR